MKTLEDEYKALQRKVWKARPEDTLPEDLERLRKIREQIGLASALRLSLKIRR